MLFVIGDQNSIANQFLFELREQNRQQDRPRFRRNLERLGKIMAYEISKKLSYCRTELQTPLDNAVLDVLTIQPVLIAILRAGLPYFTGFQNFFDQSECGFAGASRKENANDLSIQLDYLAVPDLKDREVIIIDPMLATGRSVTETLHTLLKKGKPRHLHLASVVAAPEGIQFLQENVAGPFSIWTFAVDKKLNHQYYIVPGLGDAGDLSYGEKR